MQKLWMRIITAICIVTMLLASSGITVFADEMTEVTGTGSETVEMTQEDVAVSAEDTDSVAKSKEDTDSRDESSDSSNPEDKDIENNDLPVAGEEVIEEKIEESLVGALESTGNATFDSFINDSKFTAGVYWSNGKRPEISPYDGSSCCAYCADFVKYCYGINDPTVGTFFNNINDIRPGDVLIVGNRGDGTGHWFVCLNRNGNRLYVAEGNVKKNDESPDGYVRIGWNYTISGSKFAENSYNFNCGYHYLGSDEPNRLFPDGSASGISDGTYTILSKLNTNMCLDVAYSGTSNGTNLWLADRNGTTAQQFRITKQVDGKTYRLQAVCNDLYIDNGASLDNGFNTHMWQWASSGAQMWYIIDAGEGWYSFVNHDSGLLLNVENGSTVSGTNIQQWGSNGTDAQKFRLLPIDSADIPDGTYTITSKLNPNMCLDVAYSGTSNGTNLWLADRNGTTAQQFRITKEPDGKSYRIQAVCNNLYIDCGGSADNGFNTHMWQWASTGAQIWYIIDAGGGWYSFVNSFSGLLLNVEDAGTVSGTNVQQWGRSGQDEEKWAFVHVHDLSKVPAKSATTEADGNIEYWECSSCGKLFTDSEGETEITLAETVIPKLDDISNINACTATLSTTTYTYNGKAKRPSVTVKNGSTTLTLGTDYTVEYSDNIDAGIATVTITGIGNYTGTVSKTFTINQAAPKLTFASSEVSKTTLDAPFTNELTIKTDGAITYNSTNKSVATVNRSSGRVTIKSAGTTTITVKASEGTNYKAGNAEYTLTVTNGLAIVSISDDCYGKTGTPASFHVEAAGTGITYQWQYRTAGMTDWKAPAQASAQTADYTFNLKTSYDNIEVRCIVSDDSGNEVISETRKANVFAFTSQPADAIASEGEAVNFEVSAIGNNVTYQWYYKRPNSTWKKTTVAGATTAVLPITASTVNDGTSYRCVITDEAGNKINSAAALLTLNDVSTLQVTGISEDAYDVNGESVTFHIDAAGNGDLTYQWQYKLAGESKWRTPAQASAKTPDYVFKLRPSYDNIEVRCIVSDAAGNSVTSDVRKANVFAITGQPEDAELELGEQTTFSVEAAGKDLAYQWFYMRPEGSWKKVTVAGSNTANLVITANTKNDGTKFQCRITDGLGNILVSSAALLTQT